MKPFLLITTRSEDNAAHEEHRDYLALTGLAPQHLIWHRLERTPLGRVDLNDYSGVILAGSPYNATDPEDVKSATQRRAESQLDDLLDDIVARDFPFFGACYGVGTLGRHQGAVINRTYGENTSSTTIALTDHGQEDALFGRLPSVFDAFVGHKEAVFQLPAHAVLLATSPRCPVQAFRIGQNLYATQFHPDLTNDGLVTRIQVYRDHGYFSPDSITELISTVRRADVTASHRVLRLFVERYSTPATARVAHGHAVRA
ncbi:glutamine amidotransferase [Klugiella xanthotipulae]|uniref:GMP synthase (Glutamine-hydrolysing) n=1 Tax=Klugiella xanthotipulae TaxID=244735 RepID=A0A543I5R7_9MICO|nr:glutamine amidotransferase [Klugiella xanthotipulae]TQM65800.1 GMP synthase (glutamine-hydrolysing) [Klugiella xanthotipulae]